ncbi:stage VI sporulation protein D [Neobacillus dielmonensis]|uniref:stage VI sporulation protein D n=1 Tax=Neobacillus dielmonensis TaxID=1347369 RepID=UPI0005AAF5C6|nr:stage VI sporulation protein D [Neobacillus dielmonensis]
MSQENQSYLRFSVEESLWFRKGQEVDELISISLDPDITIQENDQYVTIRGSLELSGEYKNVKDSSSEAQEHPSQKFVERVAEQEEGICEFSHRFPVDITIPNNRIQSVYDIDVLVESFDYSLPERSCLKLSAELTISGLYDTETQQEQEPEFEVVHRTEASDEEEEIEIDEPAAQSPYEHDVLFEIEARKQQEEEPKIEAFPKLPTFNYQPEQMEESEDHQPAWQFQEYNPEPVEPALNLQEARSEQHKVEVNVEVETAEEVVPEVLVEVEEVLEHEESSSSEGAPKKKVKAGKKKKAMKLTEFLARKDEGPQTARLRVCIVQKGDTIESLAERYDVSVHNFMRENQLEINQDVHEGQVLYIPAALAKK